MEDEPINQNYLIGCDTIENLPSIELYPKTMLTQYPASRTNKDTHIFKTCVALVSCPKCRK